MTFWLRSDISKIIEKIIRIEWFNNINNIMPFNELLICDFGKKKAPNPGLF